MEPKNHPTLCPTISEVKERVLPASLHELQ
jgi:hypothetical protein